jgi:hypothetical protein
VGHRQDRGGLRPWLEGNVDSRQLKASPAAMALAD